MVSTSARRGYSWPRILTSSSPLLDPPAERVLRLEADEEDQVPVVADAVGQVVEDPARLRHAATPR